MQAFTPPKPRLDTLSASSEVFEKGRHLVLVSNPRIDDGRMLIALNIPEWDQYQCFYYPLEGVDCRAVMIHIMWKLSSDAQYIIQTSAEMDVSEKNFDRLNLHNWRFA